MSRQSQEGQDQPEQNDDDSDGGLVEVDYEDLKQVAEAALGELSPEDQMAVVRGAMGEPAQVVAQSMSYSGPIPPAAELKAYDEVVPGLAERIARMAEREQDHRHTSSTKYLHNDRLRVSGATIVAVALVIGAVFSAVTGNTAVAITLGLSSPVSYLFRTVLSALIAKSDD